MAAPGILPPAKLAHPCASAAPAHPAPAALAHPCASGYAVMSNHVHVVVQVIPSATASRSSHEVAQRWTRLFPRENQDDDKRVQALAGNAQRIKILRQRLADLSWFMRRLN